MSRRPLGVTLLLAGLLLTGCSAVSDSPGPPPSLLNLQSGPAEVAFGLQVLVLLTVLSLVPAILIMMTSFVRIVIVLSFTRNALGLPQLPPNQVLLGLALFLTVFVMAPVGQQINGGIQVSLGVDGFDVGVNPDTHGFVASSAFSGAANSLSRLL